MAQTRLVFECALDAFLVGGKQMVSASGIVAKCIALAVMRLPEDDPRRLLSGEAFNSAGINGAIESDFFDRVAADAEGEALLRRNEPRAAISSLRGRE
jgi:hypothetical protein